jgi:predicted MFS family arabinose efflux permease
MTPVAPLGGLVGVEWGMAAPYLLLVGVSVYMLYALLTVLPLVTTARRVEATRPLADPVRVTR